MSAQPCGCDPEARHLCQRHEEERERALGVQAIVDLQAAVGIEDPRDKAAAAWDGFSSFQRRQTMRAWEAVCAGS